LSPGRKEEGKKGLRLPASLLSPQRKGSQQFLSDHGKGRISNVRKSEAAHVMVTTKTVGKKDTPEERGPQTSCPHTLPSEASGMAHL